MQILMGQAAYDRVRDRLPLPPGAQIVTIPAPDQFQADGQPLDADAVNPEVVWLSLDSYGAGLMGTLAGRLLKSPESKWTQIFSAGIDAPIFKTVMQKGVRLSKSSSQAIPIAEYVMGHALSLLLPVDRQRELQTKHEWAFTPYKEVASTRWLLVGYGSIGREIARRVKAFDAHLMVVRRSPHDDELADATATQADLATLLPDADVVVLAPALTDETRGMCDAAFFAAMKPGSILINIGRGALVDEDALRASLEADKPAHAVLDVFQTEPLPKDHWMWDHPKIRVSGHTSNSGDGNQRRGDELFVENLRRYFAGEPLLNEAEPREVGL
jgi:phosphoglycerate dehydrogenase-like enzyme